MTTIKTIILSIVIFVLTACGGKDNPKEIIFPEHLPKVNPNLSQDNLSGIWMVYRVVIKNNERINNDGEKVIIERNVTSKELIKVSNDYGAYRIGACTADLIHPDPLFTSIIANNSGYTELSRSEESEDFGSTGRLDISFLSSQKIYGKGWSNKTFLQDDYNRDSIENIEIFAVKVSDDSSFFISDEIDYSGSLFSTIGENSTFYDPACIAIHNDKYSMLVNDLETYSYQTQYLQQHGNDSLSFKIYDGFSKQLGADESMTIGVQRYDFKQSIDHHCSNSDIECLASFTLEKEIRQNNSFGISFTARLFGNASQNNEVYIDTQVSAIIQPFGNTDNSQE